MFAETLREVADRYQVETTRVQYQDQANPLRVGTVVEHRAGEFRVCWDDDEGGETWSDLRQHGWTLATPGSIAGVLGLELLRVELAQAINRGDEAAAGTFRYAIAGKLATHEISSTGTSRGDRGRRQIYYGHCSCGAGTTNSASRDSVIRKLRAHAAGDDRGIVPGSRRPA